MRSPKNGTVHLRGSVAEAMEFLGVGGLELMFILVVAMLVLGPAKVVEVASSLGRYWREAQRVLRETADAATVKLDTPPDQGEQRLDGQGPSGAEGSAVGDRKGGRGKADG